MVEEMPFEEDLQQLKKAMSDQHTVGAVMQKDIDGLKGDVRAVLSRLDAYQTRESVLLLIKPYEDRIAALERDVRESKQWANDQHAAIMKALNEELKAIRKELAESQEKGFEKLEKKVDEINNAKTDAVIWANRFMWGLIGSGVVSFILFLIQHFLFH